ncbi:60S ribosomal protein L14-like [Xenia sp. Carnegie-2017]|uniref:60S ribosomal protein L14-like n=1 Tax=Xenia sp. Carnegie-2017 TaxID=2897299 RepID=UPI001F03D412|nr:60S ribosomal protein L14-like [Xenia sp. Carnegie-2017]
MVYNRFVEIGRVALINTGPEAGRLCVIMDVVDQNRALVDGPCTNVTRQALAFKHMSLTDFKIKVPRSAGTGIVKKIFLESEISEKWEKTAWAKKLATRKKKMSMTDFDRFKLKIAKQRKSRILKAEVKKLKKELK